MTFSSSDHTFCLCAYGESPYLEDCMHSLANQNTRTNVLVSTSTPNDFIQSLCERFGYPLHVRDGEPGLQEDWNFSLECCQTPLATVAHQDDIYEPLYATRALEAFNESGCPLIFFTDYGELRDSGRVLSNRLLDTKRKMLAPLKGGRFKGSKVIRRRILSVGSAICCPSVSFCLPNVGLPVFQSSLKCDLDWETWECISRMDGDFLYCPEVLMLHRIHDESETTALIADSTRESEDLYMFGKFWPAPIANALNRAYGASRDSNSQEG